MTIGGQGHTPDPADEGDATRRLPSALATSRAKPCQLLLIDGRFSLIHASNIDGPRVWHHPPK
jgi:hypothetical protein